MYTIVRQDAGENDMPYTNGVVFVFAFHCFTLCAGWCCCIALAACCVLCVAPLLAAAQALTPLLVVIWVFVDFEILIAFCAICCSILCCGALLCVGCCMAAYAAVTGPLLSFAVWENK